MDNRSLVIRSKKWFQIISYIFSVLGLFLFGLVLYQLFSEETGDPAIIVYILASVSIIGIITILITLPNLHRFKIKLNPESITKVGVKTIEIPYEEIEQIVLRKGGVEVQGKTMFDRLVFGDLQEDFEEASKYLSQHLPNPDEINFRGKDEYVNEFLEYRTSN